MRIRAIIYKVIISESPYSKVLTYSYNNCLTPIRTKIFVAHRWGLFFFYKIYRWFYSKFCFLNLKKNPNSQNLKLSKWFKLIKKFLTCQFNLIFGPCHFTAKMPFFQH
ncbi:unnamed protein product [Blepharisma stoltei]|uniref:Uncharacterized protein n=1 Tax=Blepharisma stoltei TaxID=1481888 RepID=A0AAU9KDQ2_9CILI|nr:unnamed protein product [Blepharisma stoltei]